jgi:uncharacterized protein
MSESESVRALMEADRWIDRVNSQRTHLPEIAELEELEKELRRLLGELHEAESALAPVKAAYDAASGESRRLKTRAGDLDATLSTSTANARELNALQVELTHLRSLLGESEDRELELLVELEPLEERVRSIKDAAQPGVQRRAELRDLVKELQATLDEELASLRVTREEKAEALSTSVRARYEAALKRVGTSGAAQFVDGRCDGCRLALSPLEADRFRAHTGEDVLDCPECARLLLA